jgi:acyl carrier protein
MIPWTLPDLTSTLREAFAAFLRLEPGQIDPDRSIKELGMDSLTAIELAVSIEDRLGVSLFVNDFTGDETIAGLAASYVREGAA